MDVCVHVLAPPSVLGVLRRLWLVLWLAFIMDKCVKVYSQRGEMYKIYFTFSGTCTSGSGLVLCSRETQRVNEINVKGNSKG